MKPKPSKEEMKRQQLVAMQQIYESVCRCINDGKNVRIEANAQLPEALFTGRPDPLFPVLDDTFNAVKSPRITVTIAIDPPDEIGG